MTAATQDAPSTLAGLVSPLTEVELMDRLRRRELVYRPGADGGRYAALLGWSALRRMIAAGDYPNRRPDDIRVVKDSAAVPEDRWTTNGRIDVAKLDEYLAAGFSIVIVHLDEHIPALAAVCGEIRERMSEGAYVGAVVTSGTGTGAFRMHYDFEDLVILQIEGTKRWQIFGPPVAHPVRRMPRQDPPEGTEPIFDEVLEAGDVLLVPGGNWHRCESGLSTSVHIGVFFLPPTGFHAANQLTRQLLVDELFRTPLTRLEGAAGPEAVEEQIKSRLIEKIRGLDLNEFVRGWSRVAY